MSMAAALKAARAVELARLVTAVELLCACQGVDLLAPLTTSAPLAGVHARVRAAVPPLDADRRLCREHRRDFRAHRGRRDGARRRNGSQVESF